MLIDAGYPIIQPVFGSTEVGKQLLVYNIVDSPSVFDVSWQIENGNEVLANRLQSVQEQSDKELLTIYLNTVQPQSAGDAAKSPIHQLFYHRLTGGRLQRFYGHNRVNTGWLTKIEGTTRSIDDIWNKQWEINGQKYDDSLNSVIQRAIKILSPVQSDISVIGHGDAHNGNVFLNYGHNNDSMTYFDPAFAGRHSPLLDLAKPLFHNVFAMWMYFPDIMRNRFQIEVSQKNNTLVVKHDYVLHPIRSMFLKSKIENVLAPLLHELNEQGYLRKNWREYLKLALFCCPLLTLNLSDASRFTPEIATLGLVCSIEMGAESYAVRSTIDRILDSIESSI
ncbi:MAG: hypothetical protein KDD94_09150 [Calditrichaeota bacterium]|nr:hypothetical protein [Calditrichota bacterium]